MSMLKEGHIFTNGTIDKDYAKDLTEQLAALPPDTDKVIHHISSGGGNVYAGYEGYNVLKSFLKPIKSIIEGQAQSMATFIALAGDEIEMKDPGVFMIHNPYFPDGVTGDADALDKAKEELRLIENTMAEAYAKKTKKPLEEIKAMMKKETRMSPYEAKKKGFVDTVLDASGQVTALEKALNKIETFTEEFMNMFRRSQPSASSPKAVALNTKDGKVLNIDAAEGEKNFVGKAATIDGQPAQGSYTLPDGTVISCENGMVTKMDMPSQAPQETPEQKLQKQISEMQNQLQQLTTAKAAEEAKIKAEQEAKIKEAETAKIAAEKEQLAVALAAKEKEIEELKKQPIGDQNAPFAGHLPSKNMSPSAAHEEKKRTFNFLMEHMGWLRPYYSEGEIAKYVSGPSAVSILETSFNYTYPGILTTEIFYKPTLQAPAIADMVTIDQGISFRKKYNLITQLDKILKPYTGCTRTFNGNRQLITNTEVVTKEFQVSESWCKDDFTQQLTGVYNHLAQEWLKTGNKSFDPSGTPINTIISKVLVDALQRDVFRRFSFAAGNSSDDDYNQFDGLWDRLIDSSGASNYCVVRAGSALGTGTLAAGAALTALEAVYAGSNILLKNAPNKTFWVTRSVWDNYYNSLIGTGAVTEQAFENLQKGLTTLTYKGIPVKPVDLWDFFLAESDNPLFATTRHLILLTVKENHIMGVENGADLNKIEGWYERKDRKFYYESDMKFGYNYLHCDLQTIAY
jgi:ATP-dependent Clp endopeptidase proteolytic subunit ClpP